MRISHSLVSIFLLFFLFITITLNAQNRIFDNSSFEPSLSPVVPSGGYMFVNAANTASPGIQGWNTTASDGQIELWSNGMLGFQAVAGLDYQWAELNATQVSRLYQNVCLVNGETLTWIYYHRGRESSTVNDVMELNIYNAAGTVKLVTLQTAATTNADWKQYSGSHLVTLPTGSYQFSFEAISTAGGNTSIGNFVDGINIGLSAFVEFNHPTYNSPESTGGNIPQIILNGQVNTASTITLAILGGSATQGTDYTFTTTISIPPGRYSPLSPITIPLSIIDDAITETDETIQIRIMNATGDIFPTDANCDGVNQLDAVYTIIDDDIALSVSLLNLTATHIQEETFIRWATTDEKDISHYVVERSLNGFDFTEVETIKATRTGNYVASDNEYSAAVIYRLKIVELNGTSSYSSLVPLSNSQKAELKIFPNPTAGILHLYYSGNFKDITSIELYDEIGHKEMLSESWNGLASELNIQELSAGIYYLKVIYKTDSQIIRIIKE